MKKLKIQIFVYSFNFNQIWFSMDYLKLFPLEIIYKFLKLLDLGSLWKRKKNYNTK